VLTIVLTLPDAFKSLATALPTLIAQVLDAHARLHTPGGTDYGPIECDLAEASAAIERAAHRDLLTSLVPTEPFVVIHGAVHRQALVCEGTYYTLAGSVTLARPLYRPVDQPAGRVLDPIGLQVGAVGTGWLPQTATAMAFQMQQGTDREAEKNGLETRRLMYSRGAFASVAHAVGQQVQLYRPDVEHALIEKYVIPAEARTISASIDRVSVRMEEPKPRAPKRATKGDRTPKRAVACVWRMAYCATITLHDAEGKALHTIRYGRMPKGDAKALVEGLTDDVMMLLHARPDLRVVQVCDGAAEMWNLLGAEMTEAKLKCAIVRLVDLWHLLEKLGKAARIKYGAARTRRVVEGWRLRLLNAPDAAARIEAEIAAWGLAGVSVGEDHPVHEALTFLRNQSAAGRLDYARARRQGLPVGSGNVEATCKSLFEVRMKRAGARWHDESGEDIVMLRALALSDRWDEALKLSLNPLRQKVERAA